MPGIAFEHLRARSLRTSGAAHKFGRIAGVPAIRFADRQALIKSPNLSATTRFLVVDSDATFRARLDCAFRSRGIELYSAESPAEAIEVATMVQPQGAIIDFPMRAGRGLDLLSQLVLRHPDIRIVVVSGYGNIATAVEAVRRGAVQYLAKPVEVDRILSGFARNAASDPSQQCVDGAPTLARVEWEHIQRILLDCRGNISHAAQRLGLHRRSLQRKLRKFPPTR